MPTATQTRTSVPPQSRAVTWRGIPASLWGAVAVAAAALAAVMAGATWTPDVYGLPDPGPVVVNGLPLVRLGSLLAGGLSVGFLLAGFGLDTTASTTRLSRAGLRDLRVVSVAAAVWAILNVTFAVFAFAEVLGVRLSDLTPGLMATAWDVQTTRAYLISAVLALSVAVGVRFTRSPSAAAGWFLIAVVAVGTPALTGHAAGQGDHALAIISGFVHTSTAIVWAGSVVALCTHAVLRAPDIRAQLVRFGFAAVTCVSLLALSGVANATTRINSLDELVSTGYGRMLLGKTVAFGVALLVAWRVRSGARAANRTRFDRLLLAEITATGFAIGLAVVLARTDFPHLSGYEAEPPAPTLARVVLGWHPDVVFLAASVIAAGLYLFGVIELRRRSDHWPVGRTVSWLLGVAVIVWATCSGVAWYASASFALHMISLVALGMYAPLLLVMGAPITLALRALPSSADDRGSRDWLIRLLDSRFAAFLTHPAFVLTLYTVGLYGLFYSPLYGWLMAANLGEFFMHLYFLVVGFLFFWVVIGTDPAPRKLRYSVRLTLVLASLVIHSLLAGVMVLTETDLLSDWHAATRPSWLIDPVADTQLAGAIAWVLGGLPTVLVAVALSIQWGRTRAREAGRPGRPVDAASESRAEDDRLPG